MKELKHRRKILIKYLKEKLKQQDWHGIRDACVDIEVIEAQLHILEKC